MTEIDSLPILSLIALLPLTLRSVRGGAGRDVVFWLLLAAAAIGPVAILFRDLRQPWSGDLAATLWTSIAIALLLFAGLSLLRAEAHRLAGLLLPYLLLLGGLALAFGRFRHPDLPVTAPAWFEIHLILAGFCYGIVSLGAIAGLAVLCQERALKRRLVASWAGRVLPPLAMAESLQITLLTWAAIFLGAAIATGIALEISAGGPFLPFTHKTLFTVLAFVSIVFLLILHHRTGLRGKRAARWVLVGYLLLTLAYPGVKFVRDVLIGG